MNIGYINIKKTTKFFLRIKFIVPLFSLFLSIFLYHFIMDFYNPGINLLNRIGQGQKKYVLFIGEEGGFYFRLGNHLDENTNLNVTFEKTHGGLENAVRVMTSEKSFGFVQENTIRQDDFLYQRLQWLVPLYMEHMHVLYRADCLSTKYDINEKLILLGENTVVDDGSGLKKYIEEAKIGTGPIGSGTKEIARYILSALNINHHEGFHSYSMMDAYSKLKSGELHIIFVVAGAPVPEIYELISRDNIKLMGIDPLLINKLRDKYGVNYRQTNFLNKYFFSDEEDVLTLGAYSFLVASNDVPQNVTSKVVHSIVNSYNWETLDNEIRNDLARYGMPYDQIKTLSLQLEEFIMPSDIQKERDSQFIGDFLRDLFLFITAIIASTIAFSLILINVISNLKVSKYFTNISAIYNSRMPYSEKVVKNDDRFRPHPAEFETSESTAIVIGLQELFDVKKKLRDDYDTGGITENDYGLLCARIQRTAEEFQTNLFSSIWHEINNIRDTSLHKKDGKEYWLTLFREYFSYGFLNKDDFLNLRDLVMKK